MIVDRTEQTRAVLRVFISYSHCHKIIVHEFPIEPKCCARQLVGSDDERGEQHLLMRGRSDGIHGITASSFEHDDRLRYTYNWLYTLYNDRLSVQCALPSQVRGTKKNWNGNLARVTGSIVFGCNDLHIQLSWVLQITIHAALNVIDFRPLYSFELPERLPFRIESRWIIHLEW